jgi:hypothetical protein
LPCNCSDQSPFLDAPTTEFPPPSSDAAAQRQMLASARPTQCKPGRLPNFAPRVTTRFDDRAQVQHAGEFATRHGLHRVGIHAHHHLRDGRVFLIHPAAVPTTRHPVRAACRRTGPAQLGEFGRRRWFWPIWPATGHLQPGRDRQRLARFSL